MTRKENRNDGLKSFLELSESGTAAAAKGPSSPRRGAIDLMTYADARGRLEVDYAWKMHPSEARRMEDALGYAPAGGWGRLAALIAGTGALAVTNHGMYPKQRVARWQKMSDDEARVVLAEAYTRYLVPPVAAAGLFVVLGIHPVWGLRIAKYQGGAGEEIFTEDDEGILPASDVAVGEIATFGTLAGLFAGLAALPEGFAFPRDAVSAYMAACFQTARQLSFDAWEPSAGALPLFLAHEHDVSVHARGIDLVVDDIFEAVLIPAGMARRLDGGKFLLHHTIENVKVGSYTWDERRGWLGFVTATEPRFLVA